MKLVGRARSNNPAGADWQRLLMLFQSLLAAAQPER
jgi:hypothetical protein